MSCLLDALNESSIVMPTAFVKAPGSLFLDEKLPSPKLENSTFESLFQEFNTKIKLHEQSLNLCEDKESDLERSSRPSIGSFLKRYTCAAAPGDMKRVSENVADLIKIAQKLLDFYQVNLVIKISNKSFKVFYKSLKSLVFEVSLFPRDFFRKLRVTELVFCEEANETGAENKLVLLNCAEDHKLIQIYLYKIILNHIFKQNPQILVEWENINDSEDSSSKSSAGFEDSFLSLMKSVNNNYSVLRTNINKLKDLLCKYYPELTEDWLNNRMKEKKKVTKVCFSSVI